MMFTTVLCDTPACRRLNLCRLATHTAIFVMLCTQVMAQESVDFNRDIRPILSNHCFPCHGADAESRQADLRLDVRDEAIRLRAVVPEKLNDSLLWHRIQSADAEEVMPPASFNKPLSEDSMRKLKLWIESGAEYREHWAFRRVERPAVPDTRKDPWCRNDIDAFILARLQTEGLQPSAAADKPQLLRRISQDVTGLLPSPQELQAFLDDSSETAWDLVVDRMLASPHYGERWGRHWLDQARYADSNGYTIDGPRVMWPYRDAVIRSINSDIPFDQFTIEQLAGDLIPDATLHQRVSSAFHRNTMINEEGGVKPDQFRHEALIDRVNTTGAVWLGLTIGCAQCHSHKYDPITQEEYYRLYAFFNAAADANNQSETVSVRQGELFGWSNEQLAELRELETLRKQAADLKANTTGRPALNELPWKWKKVPVASVGASGSSILKIQPDETLLAKTHPAANDTFTVKLQVGPVGQPTPVTAIHLKAIPDSSLPSNGPGTAGNGNFVLTDVSLRAGSEEFRFSRAWADHSQPDYPIEHVLDGNASTGWAVNVDGAQVARGVRMNAPHDAILAFSSPITITDGFVTVVLKHELNRNYLLGHFAIEVSSATVLTESASANSDRQLANLTQRISELEAKVPGKGASVRQMVMKDGPPQETYLLKRGEFLSPDKERGPLTPGVPEALNPVADPGSENLQNRMDLARWLVSRDNPLTARVIVNRIWGHYFGRGLVETDNDLGFQGSPPTHPELLDWLAVEFMESGWSLKRLHRLILTSAVYRQSSALRGRPELLEKDPQNLLLARQSRFRVESEIVRDMALSASDLLNPTLGGPGIYLPQPDGIYDFTQNKKDWPTSSGPDRFRRTMYVMFYRSAPYPLMTTFDAPDFSTVCTRRVRSNTPLQSLTVANDQVFTELAVGLARRVIAEVQLSDDAQRCRYLIRLCLTRDASDREVELLTDVIRREQARYSEAPDDARTLTGSDAQDAAPEILAAWTSAARAILNTDEFLTRN